MSGQVSQQAVRRPVEQILVQQQLNPDGDAEDALGYQFGWCWCGDNAWVVRAVATGLVTPAVDDTPVGANIDLDNRTVLGASEGFKGQAAARAGFGVVSEIVG